MPGPLGLILPSEQTAAQLAAAAAALASTPRFAMPAAPTGPVKVILTEFLRDPLVITDLGFEFTGFRQLTGSCVGVSKGNAVTTLSAIQRCISPTPTLAFCDFWPFGYGRTRYLEGDRGQGSGAVDSVAGQQARSEGTFDVSQPGLPTFNHNDGLALTSSQEYLWSDGARIAQNWKDLAKPNTVGTVTPLSTVDDIRSAIVNGYPVLDGCDLFVGHGTLQDDVALGKYDSRGGHSTCFIGAWDHPTLGLLLLYWNQWAGNTYPQDSSGKPRCSVWVKAQDVTLFSHGGDRGQTMALSHLNYKEAPNPYPPRPEVLDWLISP